jgi:prepilin-type N-terminal cleavage/methylation domain-containing protein
MAIKKIKKFGFTLVETIIAIFVFSIIFLSLYGVYRLSIVFAGQNKNRVTATAIANSQIEKIRGLSYQSIGVEGGFPEGILEETTTTISNETTFLVETRVDYVIDPADGVAFPDDDCPNDYKRIEVEVFWSGRLNGSVSAYTDMSPPNTALECNTGGGVLSVTAFDDFGQLVPSPSIEVKDPQTLEIIKTAVPDGGHHYFSLPVGKYKVSVSKSGYSQETTYGFDEIADPEIPNPEVLEGEEGRLDLQIDKVGNFSVSAYSLWGVGYFFDSFLNSEKISENAGIIVDGNQARLIGGVLEGHILSAEISSSGLNAWDSLTFSDSEPVDTDVKYHVYFASDTSWFLIPDGDLPQNSSGFDDSPVDLSGLSTSTYSVIKMRADFYGTATSSPPFLDEWRVSWVNNIPTRVGDITFDLRGEKIIGYDSSLKSVYKYYASSTTNSSGHVDIFEREPDIYNFSTTSSYPGRGVIIASSSPSQPMSLAPEQYIEANFYLDSPDSLFLTLLDSVTLNFIPQATVRVFNVSLGYNETLTSNSAGQMQFLPLQGATYNLEIQASGYQSSSVSIPVSGDEIQFIKLTPAG